MQTGTDRIVSVATLLVVQGPDRGARFFVEREATVGRAAQNDIRLRDTEVSRRHARVCRRDGAFVIEDLQSSNGTYVNGVRVQRQELRDGDEIQLGRSTLVVAVRDEDASSELAAASIDLLDSELVPEASQIIGKVTSTGDASILAGSATEAASAAQILNSLQVLYQIAEAAVTPSVGLDQLLNRILDVALDVVGADRGCVFLRRPETGELRPQAFRDRRSGRMGDRMPVSRSIVQYVLKTREGVLTRDAPADSRFAASGSILRAGIREAMCVPMQGRYELNGVIYLDTTSSRAESPAAPVSGQFDEEKLRLLIAIARQAALAIEDHRFREAYVTAERLAAVGQTIAVLSHHIKNILQGMRGGGHLVEMGLRQGDSELVREGWQIVEKNQEKIYNLVMDMLTYSKERKPELIPADLNETVGDVVELLRGRAAEAAVAVRYEPGADVPRSLFDPDGIHRAVLNIGLNAIEAVERQDQGRVVVQTGYRRETDELFVRIHDNGPGIPDEMREHLFDLFRSSKGARGTGIGLAVSQKIVREHGGEIAVESSPQTGTAFVLVWPRIHEDAVTHGA
ncbi:MAG: FHA domain-containing protein [Planctomycetota bacterium]|nr:MAG: FHA domain-containing protein [Planctomycetota bacterium]